MGEHFVRVVVRADDPLLAERAAAEAFAAGASGLEERPGGLLHVYAPASAQEALEAALAPLREAGLAWEEASPVEEVDWSQAWREGLEPVEISGRLLIRPPFARARLRPGQAEVVIEPGQAFGTGGHASTRLALALLVDLAPSRLKGARILDVGTGTGVLALAALRLGAREAVALDLDPLAARAAWDHARRAGLASRMRVLAGPIHALHAAPFDGVVANLLRSELLPLLPAIAERLREGGFLLLSGLLLAEATAVEEELLALGLRPEIRRQLRDAAGDAWLGLRARGERRRGWTRTSPRAARSALRTGQGLSPVDEQGGE